MSRSMWIIAAVLAVLAIVTMWRSEQGELRRPWMECKESLVSQLLTGACTPTQGSPMLRNQPAPAESGTGTVTK